MPHWEYEQNLWSKGVRTICGIDEVGRGCFAGPLYVGCVGFASGCIVPDTVVINDSKKVTQKQRENAKYWIESESLFLGVGSASVEEINALGIVGAFERASRRAINNAEKNSNKTIKHVLVDAFKLRSLPESKQTAIIKGDGISVSIAAASIIAKIQRDAYMQHLSSQNEFEPYGWYTNKGYGTKSHREAILQHGVTKHHRKQFVNTFLKNL